MIRVTKEEKIAAWKELLRRLHEPCDHYTNTYLCNILSSLRINNLISLNAVIELRTEIMQHIKNDITYGSYLRAEMHERRQFIKDNFPTNGRKKVGKNWYQNKVNFEKFIRTQFINYKISLLEEGINK